VPTKRALASVTGIQRSLPEWSLLIRVGHSDQIRRGQNADHSLPAVQNGQTSQMVCKTHVRGIPAGCILADEPRITIHYAREVIGKLLMIAFQVKAHLHIVFVTPKQILKSTLAIHITRNMIAGLNA